MRNAIFSQEPDEIKRLLTRFEGDEESLKAIKGAFILDTYQKATSKQGTVSPNDFANALRKRKDDLGLIFGEEDEAYAKGVLKYFDATKRNDPNWDVSAGNLQGKSAPGVGYAEGRAVSKLGLPATLAGYLGLGWALRKTETGALRDLFIKFDRLPADELATAAQVIGKRLREIATSQVNVGEIPMGEAAKVDKKFGWTPNKPPPQENKVDQKFGWSE